jgi:hypothetical protein
MFPVEHCKLYDVLCISVQVETIAVSEDGTLLASGGLDNQIVLTAMAVPVDQLEDMPVDLSDEPWTKAKSKERKPSDSK